MPKLLIALSLEIPVALLKMSLSLTSVLHGIKANDLKSSDRRHRLLSANVDGRGEKAGTSHTRRTKSTSHEAAAEKTKKR